jgi:hypothetical protein
MSDEVPSPHSSPALQYGPIASCIGAVKSVPVEARYEEIETRIDPRGVNSEERVTGAIYRDSAGRERREYSVHGSGEETLEFVAISDFEARTAVGLDVAAKAATRFTDMGPPPGPWPLQGLWSFRGPWSLEETAETRTIEGVACRRAQPFALPPGPRAEPSVSGEIWVSDEIKYSVLEHVTELQREHHWRLFDIRRVEPPSALFAVPPGYTEVVKSKLSKTSLE